MPQFYSVQSREYLGPAVLRTPLSAQFDDKTAIRTQRVECEFVWSGIVIEVVECELRRWRGTVDEWFGSGSAWARRSRGRSRDKGAKR